MLPTLGGQTGLNVAMALFERGLIGVPGTPEMIGANAEAIATAEDREKFKEAMIEIGLEVPRSGIAHNLDEAIVVAEQIGIPVIVRPAYILGGRGTGIAKTEDDFRRLAAAGLAASPIGEILIEESIAGWKEFELEVMRDRADNCVIICSIENVDPMGVHTGDSITVAPAQTLTRRRVPADARQRVQVHPPRRRRDRRVERAVRASTRSPGRQVVIEMNPRVSRSSALASKATGFPIAKIAAKLAVGYTLDEIPNDITKATPASFEPVIDYVVTKIPRWAFEKLPGTSGRPRHADAVGRRGDGDRPHVHGEPAEGAALARAGTARPRRRPGRGGAGRLARRTICSPRSGSRRRTGCSRSASCCAVA